NGGPRCSSSTANAASAITERSTTTATSARCPSTTSATRSMRCSRARSLPSLRPRPSAAQSNGGAEPPVTRQQSRDAAANRSVCARRGHARRRRRGRRQAAGRSAPLHVLVHGEPRAVLRGESPEDEGHRKRLRVVLDPQPAAGPRQDLL